MEKYSDIRQKEVVNLKDGRCLGAVEDLLIEICSGRITGFIVHPVGKLCSFLKRGEEIVIPWCNVLKIGSDVILVETDCFQEKMEKRI